MRPCSRFQVRAGDCALKFTLTYEGTLQTGGAKLERKHARRRIFHDQLRRLWGVNSLLANWRLPIPSGPFAPDLQLSAPALQVLAKQFPIIGDFVFVPLITKNLSLEAALHFHILRPSTFKGQIADPDNVVKILIDSLKIPQEKGELPISASPGQGEEPFFVLMQDDGLLSKITSSTDELLQPINGKDNIDRSDVRIMLDVYIRPNYPTNMNIIFFSDDFEVWNHQWASAMDGSRGWSNSELRARTTQCVLRMRITASNFRFRSNSILDDEEWHIKYVAQSDEEQIIWNSRLRPIALALKEELERRLYGEPPYPSGSHRMSAIEYGTLTGPDPILDAAAGLESLIRQLP